MNLPFTPDQFFDLFGRYNADVWPMQIVLAALGVVAAVLALRTDFPRLVFAALALLWLWMGVVYHYLYFSEINAAARVFAGMFVLQGLYFGMIPMGRTARFETARGWNRWIAIGLMIYAFAIYPIIGLTVGQSWPNMPIFGVPCPTTIFTIAVLLLVKPGTVNRSVTIIPVIWSVIATSAALKLGVTEDFALPVAAVVLVARLFSHRAPLLARS